MPYIPATYIRQFHFNVWLWVTVVCVDHSVKAVIVWHGPEDFGFIITLFPVQTLMNLLQKHQVEVKDYVNYVDPNHDCRTPLQSILLKVRKGKLLKCLTVLLMYSTADVNHYGPGHPPLHMAIEVRVAQLKPCLHVSWGHVSRYTVYVLCIAQSK